MNVKEIGRRIREARKVEGLSQAELGACFNRTAEAIRLWEVGDTPPPYKEMEGLAKKLNKTEEFLLFGPRRTTYTGKRADGAIQELTAEQWRLIDAIEDLPAGALAETQRFVEYLSYREKERNTATVKKPKTRKRVRDDQAHR